MLVHSFLLLLLCSCLGQAEMVKSNNMGSAKTTDFLSGILAGLSGESLNLHRLTESLSVPSCVRHCLPSLSTAYSLITNISDQTTMKNLCGEVKNMQTCAVRIGCDVQLLNAAVGAFKFLCMDNLEAIPSAVECVKSTLPTLQEKCAVGCGFSSDAKDKLLNSTNAVDVDTLCGSSVCLLECAQKHIQVVCAVSDNSIFDAIFTNLFQQDNGYGGVGGIFGWILPEQCNDISKLDKKGSSLPALAPSRPLSVGKPVSHLKSASEDTDWKSNTTETTIMVDGEARTLQCQMLDMNRQPVDIPDFIRLYKIMKDEFDPVLADFLERSAAETRGVSDGIGEPMDDLPAMRAQLEKLYKDVTDDKLGTWRMEDLTVPLNGISELLNSSNILILVIGLVCFFL